MRISDWSSDVCSSDLIVEQSVDLRGRLADREAGRDRDRGQHALEPLARSLPMRRKLGRDDRRCGMRLGSGVAQVGRASWRERVCQYVSTMGGAGSLKKQL